MANPWCAGGGDRRPAALDRSALEAGAGVRGDRRSRGGDEEGADHHHGPPRAPPAGRVALGECRRPLAEGGLRHQYRSGEIRGRSGKGGLAAADRRWAGVVRPSDAAAVPLSGAHTARHGGAKPAAGTVRAALSELFFIKARLRGKGAAAGSLNTDCASARACCCLPSGRPAVRSQQRFRLLWQRLRPCVSDRSTSWSRDRARPFSNFLSYVRTTLFWNAL